MLITSKCPKCKTMIEVRDDWYPSYTIHRRLYVIASLNCFQDITDSGKDHKYCVQLVIYGADDTGMEKYIYTDDEQEAVHYYRHFKKFLKSLKKMHSLDLKVFLLNNGFQYW